MNIAEAGQLISKLPDDIKDQAKKILSAFIHHKLRDIIKALNKIGKGTDYGGCSKGYLLDYIFGNDYYQNKICITKIASRADDFVTYCAEFQGDVISKSLNNKEKENHNLENYEHHLKMMKYGNEFLNRENLTDSDKEFVSHVNKVMDDYRWTLFSYLPDKIRKQEISKVVKY